MKIIDKIKNGGISIITLLIICSSCNKLNTVSLPLAVPTTPAGNTVAKVIAATPSDSLFYRLLIKSGLIATATGNIADSTLRFTVFVPDNNAMKVFINGASGGAVPLNAPDAVFSGFITANLPAASAAGIASYHIVPQALTTSSFPTSFPNLQYPTILNPAPTLSALLRLTTFPSMRGAFTYDNNVPLSSADVVATNGIIHHVAAVVVPPSASLWIRISTDPDMTYLKAAILRADSGTAVAPSTVGTLQGALDNIGANLTVFAPTDSSFRSILTGQITLALIAQGMPPANAAATAAALAATPAVFTNPALSAVLTPTLAKGIVAYHVLGTRAFTVNFPSAVKDFYSIIGSGSPYPALSIQASFTGPVVSAATVKGVGNATAATLLLNPTPGTGTSDQNATNGVLHKINMVLLPQ
jgi:uncharacterized surface protein with fasciclin (FAS1) repeats